MPFLDVLVAFRPMFDIFVELGSALLEAHDSDYVLLPREIVAGDKVQTWESVLR